jgi:large subunit ribosomal protein L10
VEDEMANPRPEKVAVVDEVRQRLEAADASVVTEYRGLSVTELADLRRSLAAAGGDYKVFKNTLVRLAVAGGVHEPLESLLSGPTAIAFVHGDVSAVAKALRDFSRTNPALVVKGGLLDGTLLSSGELGALADLPSRDVLLAQVAGTIAAPLRQLAGLLQALPRNLAYGLSALVEQAGGVPEGPEPDQAATELTAPGAATADEAATGDEAATSVAGDTSDASGPDQTATEATAPANHTPAADGAAEGVAGASPETSAAPTEDGATGDGPAGDATD